MPSDYKPVHTMKLKTLFRSLSSLSSMAFVALLSLAFIPAGCNSKNSDRDAGKDYAKSLDDSIAALKTRIDSCDLAIKDLKAQEDEWLVDFTTVSDPRQAAPYMIYSDMKDVYPPKNTGIMARLADNGQFELIAALRGSRFNSISVISGENSASSDIVPPDQALNYTVDGLTIVLFTGPNADAIGKLIADNDLNDIKVVFNNGKPVKTIQISNEYKKMIMASYQLYADRRECNRLERMIPMLSRKIDILRNHKEKQTASTSSK